MFRGWDTWVVAYFVFMCIWGVWGILIILFHKEAQPYKKKKVDSLGDANPRRRRF